MYLHRDRREEKNIYVHNLLGYMMMYFFLFGLAKIVCLVYCSASKRSMSLFLLMLFSTKLDRGKAF